jgi:hypothetical protein
MSESFLRLKKKFLQRAVIYSVIWAVFVGLAVAGILLLIFKLCAIDIGVWIYPVAGVVGALLAGGLCFLICRPTDKKIAKVIDNDFAFAERAQTLVEFGDKSGELVELQRADTDERLAEVKPKKPKLATVIKCSAVSVLAIALFCTGLLVPAKKKTEPIVEEDPFELTALQSAALTQLIVEVNSSTLEESLKTSIVTVLDGLLSGLDEPQTTGTMTTAVYSASTMIDGFVRSVNTYIDFRASFLKSSDTLVTGLAKKLLASSKAYKLDGRKITSYDMVTQRAVKSEENISSVLDEYVELVEDEYKTYETSAKFVEFCNTLGADFKDRLFSVSEAIADYENDALYDAIITYANFLTSMTGEGYTVETLKKQVSTNTSDLVDGIVDEMCLQSYNRMMAEFIRQRLSTIFGVTLTDPFDEEDADDTTDDTNDDNSDVNAGGYSKGEDAYGSKDMIFYPGDSELDAGLVEYGKVLQNYYAVVTEYINRGDLSAEMQVYIQNYFAYLYNGISENN